MSLFWGVHHGFAVREAAHDASSARSAARKAQTKTLELEARCDKALLVCEALWTILRDKLGVSEEELVNRVNEIDLSDGKLDGKVRKPAVKCGKCGRNVAQRFAKCIYCGRAMEKDVFAG